MPKVAVIDIKGKETNKVELPESVFTGKVKTKVLYQAMVKYRASLRQGNASTKERSDVSGSGAKPHRQKGTGQARAGHKRSPLWKGGGVTFGPHPRDFAYTLPKKIRQAALRESLNAKFSTNNLLVLEEIKDKLSKTKEFAGILKSLKLRGKILAVLDGSDDSLKLVTRNIPRFELVRGQDVNAFNIMKNKTLIVTKAALDTLVKRIEQ